MAEQNTEPSSKLESVEGYQIQQHIYEGRKVDVYRGSGT